MTEAERRRAKRAKVVSDDEEDDEGNRLKIISSQNTVGVSLVIHFVVWLALTVVDNYFHAHCFV